jgi:hypothetical protein
MAAAPRGLGAVTLNPLLDSRDGFLVGHELSLPLVGIPEALQLLDVVKYELSFVGVKGNRPTVMH